MAALRRTMSNREFVEWQAYYDLKGQIADVRSRHPTWPMQRVMEWAEAAYELHKK